ncbi:hypothetical protein HFM94_02455 [Faecalicatena fissicatena]|uniref:hypothetical protein n=1 Tax=Faecalicatena fissicatena TaxID=290055 RepID=UPI00156DF735|nr:hypothetical protein [Faecalicatena fissicatena]NSE32146.1 hypothetical protein [Faecalicatena fissicatena]
MGFFDKALKKVQDVGENIAASANNVKTVVETSVQDTMEITGLKRQIRELEKEMDAQYLQIGKKYAEFVADMDDAEPETAENEAAEAETTEATESSEVIDEVKEEAIDEVKAEAAAETVDEAKEEAAAETIDEVKAEDTAETIDEEKEVSKEPAEDKVAEESDEDEEPVFDVSDFLTIIKQDQAKKKELENQLAEVEKRAKQNTLLREKTKAEESFEQEKGVLDKALAMEIISKEEYEQKLNIAKKKVENFEEIKKIEQQFEMGIITKEEKDEKINAILNA